MLGSETFFPTSTQPVVLCHFVTNFYNINHWQVCVLAIKYMLYCSLILSVFLKLFKGSECQGFVAVISMELSL